ncbi:MAG TPA: isocitrate/isopropylmalate family dehydrogenase [Burkholderiales bacterium]|nr:isocitrate/isopropylmalate family dehydrogenase [Burkholderiales bacterium]
MRIGVLEGDDIGLEVVPETIKVVRAAAAKANLAIDWSPVPIGKKAFDEQGNTLPPGTLDKLDTLDGWVLGPIGHQAYPRDNPNSINPHPILRRHYDLFANIRPSKSYPGVPCNCGAGCVAHTCVQRGCKGFYLRLTSPVTRPMLTAAGYKF